MADTNQAVPPPPPADVPFQQAPVTTVVTPAMGVGSAGMPMASQRGSGKWAPIPTDEAPPTFARAPTEVMQNPPAFPPEPPVDTPSSPPPMPFATQQTTVVANPPAVPIIPSVVPPPVPFAALQTIIDPSPPGVPTTTPIAPPPVPFAALQTVTGLPFNSPPQAMEPPAMLPQEPTPSAFGGWTTPTEPVSPPAPIPPPAIVATPPPEVPGTFSAQITPRVPPEDFPVVPPPQVVLMPAAPVADPLGALPFGKKLTIVAPGIADVAAPAVVPAAQASFSTMPTQPSLAPVEAWKVTEAPLPTSPAAPASPETWSVRSQPFTERVDQTDPLGIEAPKPSELDDLDFPIRKLPKPALLVTGAVVGILVVITIVVSLSGSPPEESEPELALPAAPVDATTKEVVEAAPPTPEEGAPEPSEITPKKNVMPAKRPKTPTKPKGAPAALKESNPVLAEEYYRQGNLLIKDKKAQQAIDVLQKSLQADGTFGKTYRSLGVAYMLLGKEKNAILAYEKFLQFDPNHKDAAKVREIVTSYYKKNPR